MGFSLRVVHLRGSYRPGAVDVKPAFWYSGRVPRDVDAIDLGRGADAALLLHGFTGTPFELHPLAERLADAGFRVLAPLLPGHGEGDAALGRTGLADWLGGARLAHDRLRGDHGRVFVAGLSLGGLLAILLAADETRDVAALALLAPALDFHGASRLYRDLFRWPLAARLWPRVAKGGSDLSDLDMRCRTPACPYMPTACAREVALAARAADRALERVRAPTLVLQGARDAVVPLRAAKRVARRVGSGPARLAMFARSAHQLALDVERDAVAEEIERFFVHFARGRSTGGGGR
jgi:carboxylesterase